MIGHGPEHIDELILILGLHMNEARNGTQVSDVKQSVVGRAVIPGKATSVHAHSYRQVLQSDIVDDHVDGALHEGRVNGEEWPQSLGGMATGE